MTVIRPARTVTQSTTAVGLKDGKDLRGKEDGRRIAAVVAAIVANRADAFAKIGAANDRQHDKGERRHEGAKVSSRIPGEACHAVINKSALMVFPTRM